MGTPNHHLRAIQKLFRMSKWFLPENSEWPKKRLPGFSYSEFDRAGHLRMDCLSKFLEIERMVMVRMHQKMIPFYPSKNAEFLLRGNKMVINPRIYLRAGLDYPLDQIVKVDHVGSTSITISIRIFDVETQEEMAVAYRRPTLVDMVTKKPVKLPKEIYRFGKRDELSDSKQLVLPEVNIGILGETVYSQPIHPRYMDYDFFQHVNQSAYVGYALECAAGAYWAGKLPHFKEDVCHYPAKEIIAIYGEECFVGDVLTINMWIDKADPYKLYFDIRKKDKTACFVTLHYGSEIIPDV